MRDQLIIELYSMMQLQRFYAFRFKLELLFFFFSENKILSVWTFRDLLFLENFNTFTHSCAILYVKFVYFIVNSFFEGRAYDNVRMIDDENR